MKYKVGDEVELISGDIVTITKIIADLYRVSDFKGYWNFFEERYIKGLAE